MKDENNGDAKVIKCEEDVIITVTNVLKIIQASTAEGVPQILKALTKTNDSNLKSQTYFVITAIKDLNRQYNIFKLIKTIIQLKLYKTPISYIQCYWRRNKNYPS